MREGNSAEYPLGLEWLCNLNVSGDAALWLNRRRLFPVIWG